MSKKLASGSSIIELDVKYGEALDVTVYVPKDATGKVILEVDGKNYTSNIVAGSGKAVFTDVPVPAIKAGRYNITAYFGDAKYLNKTATGVFNVVKHDMPLTITVVNKDNIKVGDDVAISVTLPGIIAGEKVSIEINGQTYENVTDAQGIARFTVPSITYGDKTVVAIFNGTDKYVCQELTALILTTVRVNHCTD